MKTALLSSALVLALGTAAMPAEAGGPPISVQFTIGTPAPAYTPVAVAAAPSMVWMPEMGAYVALQFQEPLFFASGVYYLFRDGVWLSGPHYGGPWHRMEGPPPQALRRFKRNEWHHVQERAERRSRDPKWAHFRAGPQGQSESHMPAGRGGEMQHSQPGGQRHESRPQQQQHQQKYQHQGPGERQGQEQSGNRGNQGQNRPYGPNGN